MVEKQQRSQYDWKRVKDKLVGKVARGSSFIAASVSCCCGATTQSQKTTVTNLYLGRAWGVKSRRGLPGSLCSSQAHVGP